MNRTFFILFCLLFTGRPYAMDLPVIKKLYAGDFEKLGVKFTPRLILDSCVDRSRILQPMPFYETESNIRWYTQAIQMGHQAALYLKYINNKVGYGVFADVALQKDDIVGEYTGKVITQSVAVKKPVAHTGCMIPMVCYDGCFFPEALIIDARREGNFTRFVNHSYKPNVDCKMVYCDSMWHTLFIASEAIDKDSQLFINYGKGYWEAREIEPIELLRA